MNTFIACEAFVSYTKMVDNKNINMKCEYKSVIKQNLTA